MHRMTVLLFTLLLALELVATTAWAQRQRMTPQERTNQLASQLSLTDEQKAKVLDIFTVSDEKMRAASEASAGDRAAMRETMRQLRQQTDVQMKSVLTEDQYSKWQKLREQAPGRRGRQEQPR